MFRSYKYLEGELMQQRRHTIKAAVQQQQLAPGLLWPHAHAGLVCLVCVQLLLHQLSQLSIAL
jgi:hypothetical protein